MSLTTQILLLASLTLLTSVGRAESGQQQFNIPAQNLSAALQKLAAQSGASIFYTAESVSGHKAPALNGQYSTRAALSRLLAGSGLVHAIAADGSISVKPAPPAPKLQPVSDTGSDTTLPKVTVEADSAYDPEYYADPYNKDYVIPNATAGTKTDTPIMETPLNVQVISKQVLKDRQVITLADSLKNVSGVTTNTQGGNGGFTLTGGGTGTPITLRGFASETFFRNGFRLQQGAASRELANVESVEVLKGPAAILYGLVEPGGMVNVTTKQPLATPYYCFTQQFGSYDLYRTTIDATGPVAKNMDLLYRMNMSYENSGSFREFVGKEDVFLAPVLKWAISPRTQVTVEMEYNHQHSGLDANFIPIVNGQLLNIPFSRNYGEYAPATTETVFGGFNWSHMFNDDWTIKHRFSVNQSNVLFKNFIFPGIVDPAGTQVSRSNFGNNSQYNTYSTNLDLVGHFDTGWLKHTLLIGGDYYRIDQDGRAFFNIDSFTNPSLIDVFNPIHPGSSLTIPSEFGFRTITQTDQYGLYAQDQIKLPYDIHVTGGLRYQYIHQKNTDVNGAPFGGDTTNSAQTQDAVTPRVGILWQPQNWISLYANYTESFGVNAGLTYPNRQPVAPTSASQYEGGFKTQFFDGHLRATLAYYDLTKTNVAADDPDSGHFCGGIPGPGSCKIAIGAIRSRGPELDIQGEILPGWNAILTWANQDIIVTKTNANNDPLTVDFNPLTIGSRLYNVPRNTGSFWNTYEIQDGDFKGLKIGGGVTVRDQQLACCDTPAFKVAGYATLDLMASYSRNIGDAKVSVQFNVNNLLDKHYYSSVSTFRSDPTFLAGYANFVQPRTFMGQVSVQY